nr:PREDICTED: ZW10 interactor [Latimeria chalumnae]|eukprot:XP_014340523.1 PREDICTED: ZW10 interactor [Latimeria chalumnae]
MAAASRLLAFLERLSDGDYEGEKEGTTEGELPAKVLAQYWKDNHKKHKLMCSQLYVRNFLLSSLEKLDPAIGKEELTKQEIRKEINEVKQNWKSLKLNYLQKVEEIQAAIPEFLYKIQLLEKGRETLCKSLQKLQAKIEDDNASDTQRIQQLEQRLNTAMECIDDLENRTRRNNVRIVSFLEGNLKVLPGLLDLEAGADLEMERVHRALGLCPAQGQRPRAFVIKLLWYPARERLLGAAWRKGQVMWQEHRISLYPDFSQDLQMKRQRFGEVRKLLQERKLKYRMFHPAILKITERCVELRRAELDRKISEVTDCIQKCEAEIHQQKEELQSYSGYAEMWATVTNRGLEQQKLQEALQGLKVLSLVEDELTLELNPQHIISTTRLKPLILSLLWTPQDSTIIRTNCEIFPVEEILSSQPVTDLPSTILRIYNCYLSQSELLAEIQQLQHRFAIDWLHTERKLLFLKGNTVCTFIIGHGYPNSGGIQLLSIQPKHGSIDYTNIKPSQGNPSLQDWLDYLSSSPEF